MKRNRHAETATPPQTPPRNPAIKAALAGKSSETSLPQLSEKKPSSPVGKLLTRVQSFFVSSGKRWNALTQQKKNGAAVVAAKTATKKAGPFDHLKRRLPPAPPLVSWVISWRIWKIIFFPLLNPYARAVTIIMFLGVFIGLLYILRDLPSPRRLTSSENFAVSTQIFDRNGKLLYTIFADENRLPIKLKDLPKHVYQATIAIEDQNFYHHFGFDVIGIVRATRNTLQGKRLEGGSTITQQLVKNALLTPERSIQRKAKEGILAVATEVIYTKDEILEMYLNYISYGGTSVGIEAAAKRYFNKSAKDLTLAEAALLAGLPQSPTRFSPFGSNAKAAKERQKDVLRRMAADGYITQEQATQAENEVLNYAISKTDIEAPHFVFYVRDYLYDKYGAEKVERGGLRVTTTLDLDLQNVAQASLSAQISALKAHRVGNGAALVTKPDTGEILAMVGSKDYFNTAEEGQVNVTVSERQPGSSIKPITYAVTFQEKVLNPGSHLLDVPTCFTVPGQKPYCPKNYDGSFKGPVSIRFSLGNSLNIPAVKALRLVGVEKFIEHGRRLGLTTWQDPSRYGLSLTLGGGEIRMVDLAQAFGVLANQGVKVPLTPVLKIEDFNGNVLEETDINGRRALLKEMTDDDGISEDGDLVRVLDRAPAYLAAHIMQDNSARTAAFGPRSKLVIPNQIVSAKTGTTNDLKDNWTVGFTPEFLTIVWVGNNDGRPMNQSLVSGITGAAPIWNDIMSYILKGREPVWQEKPDDVASASVCVNGMPPEYDTNKEKCSPRGQELYWKESQPSQSRYVEKEVWIHPETGLPLKPGESTDGLVLEKRVILTDPFTNEYCFDCNRPVTPEGDVQYEQINVSQDFVIREEEDSGE